MACPTCSGTMQCLVAGQTWWCPCCGTLREISGIRTTDTVPNVRVGLLAACEESLGLLEVRLNLAEIADEEKAHIDTLRRAIARAKGG